MILQRIDGTLILRTYSGICAVREAIKRKLDLTDASIIGLDLCNYNFTGVKLANAEFRKCKLDGVIFTGANLSRVEFFRCRGELAVFAGANMEGAWLRSSSFSTSDFSGAKMDYVRIQGGYFGECSMNRIRAIKLNVTACRFVNCLIDDARIAGGSAHQCRLTACAFTDCDLGRFIYTACEFNNTTCNGALYHKKMRKSKHTAEAEAMMWAELFARKREECGYSSQFVADALGISRSMVTDLDRGRFAGNVDKLIGLMRLFNLTLQDIYDERASYENGVGEQVGQLS